MATTNKTPNSKKPWKKKKGKSFKKEDREEIMKDRPGKNDISWYGDSKLIEAAGRINFTNPLGKPISWAFDNSGSLQLSLATAGPGDMASVPGVMSIFVEPGIGISSDATSAANVFMRNFYSWIRHANSGHTNYNAPDLGIYVMAVDQVHLILEHLVRIYGVARTYSSANRYLPTALLYAMGCDPFDASAPLYSNLATYRSELLNLMIKVGTFVVPKDFKIIERHKSLFKYVYSDGSTSKSQCYVFRPEGYKIYRETGSGHTGGYLEHHTIGNDLSFGAWIALANTMVDALVQSEDMNIMSGDILKAYGVENTYKLEYFSEDYTVVPMYNPEMLLEIHNVCLSGDAWSDADFDIYQDPNLNIIKYEPIFKVGQPYQNISPIVDMPVEVPSPEQIMIATRFVNMGSVGFESGSNSYKYFPDSIGSEVATRARIYVYYNNSGTWTMGSVDYFGGVDASAGFANWRHAGLLSNFDWHMPFKVLHKTDNTHWELVTYFGEFENYTPFYEGDISKLHEVALIGEFKVPLMGVMEFGSTK